MARPLRVEFPGAYYHVMNRGNNRQNIFISDKDRYTFLEALSDSCEIHDVRIIAYVLMSNHYHLLIQTPQANLSEFMRHFQVTYTVRFNRQHDRPGHVFQGRFKSLLVEADEYLLPLSRYIHLNPIRTSHLNNSEIKNKEEYLQAYPWSSYPGYCSLKKRNKSFNYSWLLHTYYGSDGSKGRRRYRAYVVKGIDGKIANPFDDTVHQSILGSQGFVDWIKTQLPDRNVREVPSQRNLQYQISAKQIVGEIAKYGGVESDNLLDRKTKAKLLRQIGMELCYRYSILKQKEIGELFGVDYSTVSQNRKRLKDKLATNRRLRKRFDEIRENIQIMSKQKI
jgi:putative transposase